MIKNKNWQIIIFTGTLILAILSAFQLFWIEVPVFTINKPIDSSIEINRFIALGPYEFDESCIHPESFLAHKRKKLFKPVSENLLNINAKDFNPELQLIKPNIESYIDFNKIFHVAETDSIPKMVFTFCYLNASDDIDVHMSLNSAQNSEVWLNNQKIYEGLWKRRIKRKTEDFVRLNLKKGYNLLFIKIGVTEFSGLIDHWELNCRILDQQLAFTDFKADFHKDILISPEVKDNQLWVHTGPLDGKIRYKISGLDGTLISEDSFVVKQGKSFQQVNISNLPESIYSFTYTSLKQNFSGHFIKEDIQDLHTRLKKEFDFNESKCLSDSIRKERLLFLYFKIGDSKTLEDRTFWTKNYLRSYLDYLGLAKTRLYSYWSDYDHLPQSYLFHYSNKNNENQKIPLIIYMPYYIQNSPDKMHESWYISNFDFINIETSLCDQNVFALLMPYLRNQTCYNKLADIDFHEVLQDVFLRFNIDTTRIFGIGGCSGAKIALQAAIMNPGLFRGIGITNGVFTEESPFCLNPIENIDKLSKETQFFILHDPANEFPIEAPRLFVKLAQGKSIPVRFEELKNSGHFNPPEDIDAEIIQYFGKFEEK